MLHFIESHFIIFCVITYFLSAGCAYLAYILDIECATIAMYEDKRTWKEVILAHILDTIYSLLSMLFYCIAFIGGFLVVPVSAILVFYH